jgi:GT2 family glycosyltransferase
VLPDIEAPTSKRIGKHLPSAVRSQLASLPAGAQFAFLDEFHRRSKSLWAAYFCSLFYCHHALLGRRGTTLAMWLASLATLGMLGMAWWLVDLVRLPGLVRSYNQALALDILRNMRAIES